MPEILLLTWISRLGLMAPTARAFSTTAPRETATVLKPLSSLELAWLNRAAPPAPRSPTSTTAMTTLRMLGPTPEGWGRATRPAGFMR